MESTPDCRQTSRRAVLFLRNCRGNKSGWVAVNLAEVRGSSKGGAVILDNLGVSLRLKIGFLLVFALVSASALTGVWRLGTIRAIVGRLVAEDAVMIVLAERWEKYAGLERERAHAALLLDDRIDADKVRGEMAAAAAKVAEIGKEINAALDTDEESRLFAAIAERREAYVRERDNLIKRRAAGEDVRDDLGRRLEPLSQAYLASVGTFAVLQQRHLDQVKDSADRAVFDARMAMGAMIMVGLLTALVAAVLIARSIVRPVGEARRAAERIAAGDLTRELEVQGRDEVAEMGTALSAMQHALRRMIDDVRRAADTVNTASSEIAQGHTDLSSRTEEQASSLVRAAASMEQISATVSQNAENAKQASQHASAASQVAERGGKVVEAVVTTMSGISASSKKIADIIGVIDGIAFQTNILALNAAVEAARAGEQGRGFAVVTSEVRSLAQRSGAAAREIRQLISDSVKRIDAGSKEVAEAGRTMDEIVESVRRVNGLMAEISTASQEQSQSVAQVSGTVQQMEQVTQQNAAMVEEVAAASASLEEQAAALIRAVGSFRLARGDSAASQPSHPSRLALAAAKAWGR
ncbi:MAG: methyl-accepting chemotaxis protein [Clostridia bacterium]